MPTLAVPWSRTLSFFGLLNGWGEGVAIGFLEGWWLRWGLGLCG
jgi:hypothetical protein